MAGLSLWAMGRARSPWGSPVLPLHPISTLVCARCCTHVQRPRGHLLSLRGTRTHHADKARLLRAGTALRLVVYPPV